ncbi:hypothetical protein LCGC14_1781710 [marine sediment metagenome]|uniref:DUF7352 domain-containing protein n=1 Tax=marine sediment metagenome TaxID=412755 RepID=A0A0F9GV50_9ZZZZ
MPQDTIKRYEIPFNATIRLQIPESAQILHFGCETGKVFVWMQIDPDRPNKTRGFAVLETSTKINSAWEYIGTCDVSGVIWHLYDVDVPRTQVE